MPLPYKGHQDKLVFYRVTNSYTSVVERGEKLKLGDYMMGAYFHVLDLQQMCRKRHIPYIGRKINLALRLGLPVWKLMKKDGMRRWIAMRHKKKF